MKMALLQKAFLNNPKTVQKTIGIFYNVSRNRKDLIWITFIVLPTPNVDVIVTSFSDWNYQYKPGPYPKTNEERAAAAKKYGLTIEEYTPYPESMGYGDYPKLPDIGADSKDPHYPWDMPELKRNFNEPVS